MAGPAGPGNGAGEGKGGTMAKAICKWTKAQYVKQLDKLIEIVKEPTYICKDCGRVANDKKWLCKPEKMP